jgi:hypothetical protein
MQKKLYATAFGVTLLLLSGGVAFLLSGPVRGWLLRREGWLIVADSSVVEIPSVEKDGTGNATVSLCNIATHAARVVGVRMSCNCVVSRDMFPFELSAGEKREIKFTIRVLEKVRNKGGDVGDALFLIAGSSLPVRVHFRVLPVLPKSNDGSDKVTGHKSESRRGKKPHFCSHHGDSVDSSRRVATWQNASASFPRGLFSVLAYPVFDSTVIHGWHCVLSLSC